MSTVQQYSEAKTMEIEFLQFDETIVLATDPRKRSAEKVAESVKAHLALFHNCKHLSKGEMRAAIRELARQYR